MMKIVTNCIRGGGKTCIKNSCEDADDPNGKIECAPGLEECGTGCTDLQTDVLNCGECGNECTDGRSCVGGKCDYACDDSQQPDECPDGCHNLLNDIDNCGECGHKCDADQICNDGKCAKSCTNANETACGTECYDLMNNAEHCGDCYTTCGPKESCITGKCRPTCDDGQTLCDDDRCYDLFGPQTCGTCESHKACDTEAGEICTSGGTCKNPCEAREGTTWCENAHECVDYRSDHENCGGCGDSYACGPEELCVEGSCSSDGCPASQVACGGTCIDPDQSTRYCGATEGCQTYSVCGAGAVCDGGSCECGSDASPDAVLCAVGDGTFVCTDPQTDLHYCGCGEDVRGDAVENAGLAGTDCAALPHVAQGGVACGAGSCIISRCADGWADCDGDPANGCEVDLQSEIENCGACGTQCADPDAVSVSCVAGICRSVCPEGMDRDENGLCINVLNNINHCGYSNHRCSDYDTDDTAEADKAVCVNGFCQIPKSRCSGGYAKVKVNGNEVSAYCIGTEGKLRSLRDSINAGHAYPDATNNGANAYLLTDDLDLENETAWVGIGTASVPFSKGIFLGNGHTIKGTLTSTGSYLGLFGYITQSVLDGFDLELTINANGTDVREIGGLAGRISATSVSNSRIKGKVQDPNNVDKYDDETMGVMFGRIYNTNSFNHLTVYDSEINFYGGGQVGGICGTIYGDTLKNIRVTNTKITFMKNNRYMDGVGLIAGVSEGNTVIKNSHVDGTIEMLVNSPNGKGVGGIMGWINKDNMLIEDCTADVTINTPNIGYVGGIVGTMTNGAGAVTNNWIKNSTYSGDITCSTFCGGIAGTTWHSGYIGSLNISGCSSEGSITATLSSYANDGVGGIAGFHSWGVVTDSHSSMEINGICSLGGLIGQTYHDTVSNSYATGNVTAKLSNESRYVGGLLGYSVYTKLDNSWAKGNVKGYDHVGGFIGRWCDESTSSNVAAFGTVTGISIGTDSGAEIGGLIGGSCTVSGGPIVLNGAALGNVEGNTNQAGGLVGHMNTVTVRNTYSLGNVEGKSPYVGAFLGRSYAAKEHVYNSYYLHDSYSVDVGGTVSPATKDIREFTFDADNVAQSKTRSLAESLDEDVWKNVKCELKTGPGTKKPGVYTVPMPEAIIPSLIKEGICSDL